MRISCLIAVLLLGACVTPPPKGIEKVRIDLRRVDADGYEGPPAGKRVVNYQFCVPNTIEKRMEINELDPAAKFESEVAGRAGCTADEILVLTSTQAPQWRGRLEAIAALPYVKSIRRTPLATVSMP